MKNIINSALKEITLLGHLQSIGAATLVWIYYQIANHPANWVLIVSTYSVFQSIYYFDRIIKCSEDLQTNKERCQLIIRNRGKYIYLIIIFITTIVLLNIKFKHYNHLVFYLFLLGFGMSYPLIIKGATKKIFMFKNYFVSLFFTLPIIYSSIASGNPSFKNVGIVVFIVSIFIESMSSQVLLDVKDIATDKNNNLKTLPALLGIYKTKKILLRLFYVKLFVIGLAALSINMFELLMFALTGFIVDMLAYNKISKDYKVTLVLGYGKLLLCFLATSITIIIYG